MGKRQPLDAPPDRRNEDLQRSNVPSVGTPAPPIDPDAVPGLMLEKPKLKRKNSATLTPMIIIAVLVVMVVLGALSTLIVERRSMPAVVVVGDGRIEPPPELPSVTIPKGYLSGLWQPRTLASTAWDIWAIKVNANNTIEFRVHPTSANFIPIFGLYNWDGKLLATAQEDRMSPQKSIIYTFTNAGAYTILVSNIGGASGDYEIMSQLER